jgi:hypothetical protein
MNPSRGKLRKLGWLALAAVLLIAVSYTQRDLNRVRRDLGLTRVEPLQNAPPVLVFTTVVLGGFRGLIANALWVRAMELQDEDRFFEMVQLADWITKLQPRIPTVWTVVAWNMSYNISIKFSSPADRWGWVKRGIELLRDEGLYYNPHEVELYRELAWHFQHKMGHNLDDAHLYFKSVWASEMQAVLGGGRPNWDELINPQTDEAKARVQRLREVYKMDPVKMRETDERYGPLEWRLPESHAIYWANLGRQMAKTKDQLIKLRRNIYQSLYLAFHRGRLLDNTPDGTVIFEPNLDIFAKTHAAYEEMMAEDEEMRTHIGRAHRNALLDAVYFFFVHQRLREANEWLAVVKRLYPQDYPASLTLEDYVLQRVGEDVGETDMNKTISNIRGALTQSFYNLAIGEDDQAQGYLLLARNVWNRYMGKIVGGPSEKRVGLPPLETMRAEVLTNLLGRFTPPMAAALRTRLNLPAPTEPASSTPAPAPGPSSPPPPTSAPTAPPAAAPRS